MLTEQLTADAAALHQAILRHGCLLYTSLRKRVNPIFRSLCFFLPAPSTSLLSARAAALPCCGSPSAIHEVLISLRSQGQRNVRGFDLVLGIYEVLISPISRRRAFTRPMSLRQPIYEVLISSIVPFSV